MPRYRHEGERDDMPKWWARKGDAGVRGYIRDQNVVSIDGLPAVDPDPS